MSKSRKPARLVTVGLALTLAALLLPASTASAGRVIASGHDADLHCTGMQQCGFVRAAVQYVRAGAPKPSLPVLILDRLDLDVVTALDNAFGPGVVPREVVDPRSPQFFATSITTSRYSALVIASDITCGGCDLNEPDSTPDSNAINARSAEIASFFNAGGGIYAGSGAGHGDGDPATGPDTYYSFLPFTVAGIPVSRPFCLTPVGIGLGLEDQICPEPGRRNGSRDDINCCTAHNSFLEPASLVQVAERDLGADGTPSTDDQPQTLVAEGRVRFGSLEIPRPVLGRTVNVRVLLERIFVAPPSGSLELLIGERQIPVRSRLDARGIGTILLESATGRGSRTQVGSFGGGIFQVLQSRRRSGRGLTTLRLEGGNFRSCRGARGGGNASAAQRSHRIVRRVRSGAKGRFRTRGRHAAATVQTVRGDTVWLTADRCDGTLTRVSRGRVSVRDFRLRRTVVLRAGKGYLARAR
jgi:hypothetical protein